MHNVVIDKPYVFVPPYYGKLWPKFLQLFVRRRLRRVFGVTEVECRGLEHLRESRAAGHSMLLAPNHSHPADPFVVSEVARRVGEIPFTLASWHLFMQGRFDAFILRRAGVFSIYREGMDRAAITAATDILVAADRPLVIFPEGVISRSNDRLNALMEGTTLVSRAAAKKRAAATPPGQVVIHPIALRYTFLGPVDAALAPALDDIENRLSWRPQRHLSLADRITKVGEALLGLKEVEYIGHTQQGELFARAERLVNHILVPLEQEWTKGNSEGTVVGTVVGRVKKLRTAILPDMVNGGITDAERERRWRQLADLYLAQQIACYPPDYIRANPRPQRMIETVERFEEDLTDACRIYSPTKVTVTVCPAIPVSPTRDRSAAEDPVMSAIESQLKSLLEQPATT